MEYTLRAFNAKGEVGLEVKKSFNFKRFSMLCAAIQKSVDSLYVSNITTKATVTPPSGTVQEFDFDANGRSQFKFPS